MTDAADRVILVVEDDRIQLEALKILLTNRTLWRVEGVSSAREAIARLLQSPVAAMITDEDMPGMDGLSLLSTIRNDPTTSHMPVLILTASGDADVWRRAWSLGADGVLQKPTHPSVLRAALEACLARREEAAVNSERLRLADRSVEGMIDLVVRKLDALEPGTARRGESLSKLADVMGSLFELEQDLFPELRRAARLYDIARISTGLQAGTGGDGWRGLSGRETAASAAVLRTIPALEGVADLVEASGANWDGSGYPADLQKGQIPVRSRILRTVVDLMSLISPRPPAVGVSIEEAVPALEMHSGTWYDPAAITILQRISMGKDGPVWDPDIDLYAVDDLRVGMELAADLTTASGIKLLSKGAFITASNLDLVRRRHDRDPIPNGVPIKHRKE